MADDIRKYGKLLVVRVQERLHPFFSNIDNEFPGAEGAAYVWARTIKCSYTGKPIPLSPNWWLRKGSNPVAVRPVFKPNGDKAIYEIVCGKTACERAKPDDGTVRRGNAISPWAHNQPVDGDYIKAEAQAGRMGQQLYALAIKKRGGFEFRAATETDEQAAEAAEGELARKLAGWEANGWVPNEPRRAGRADWAAEIYGMPTWRATFAPRQLFAMLTILEELHGLADIIAEELPEERARAVATMLAIAFDKAIDYNSRQVVWDISRQKVAHAFARHDFSFKWSHAEFDASRNLIPWVVEQVSSAYEGIATLATPIARVLKATTDARAAVQVIRGNAADLGSITDRSIVHICVDPPYYDNVMYAECSNYFYVWLKRLLGEQYPTWFQTELADSENEAVVNVERFASLGSKKKQLAQADYERKMAAAFREMHRVLRDDGVLTVMFTHKKVEAWDTLATSLIGSGFAIHSSWPVHTESEHSLHQAKKNAAQSTILLTCRKRRESTEPVWWDDIKGTVRRTAREKAEEFERQGIRGVDLYIATFGPTLAILSENWPVLTAEVDERTGEPKPLRPEVALDLAREEVVALRKQGLLLGRAVQFDLYTDWYLMAWDAFRAEQFPGAEALKLAIAVGLNFDDQVIGEKRLVTKKGANVNLQQPKARRKKDMVDPDKKSFDCWVDAVHTAMLLYDEDGAQACKSFLQRINLLTDTTFKACIQAMLNAIPRTKEKGKFVRPEADTLEAMRLAFFDDLVPPVEEELKIEPEQLQLLSGSRAEVVDGDDEDDDEEDDEA